MERAVIRYQEQELEAWEDEGGWTVRLGELEASSRYLDLALAALLDDVVGVHQLAARLLTRPTSPGRVKADEAVAA
jgi:hypothetical protein